jgi:hypothetical protein
MLIGVDAPDNVARYYVLTRQGNPSASNLTYKGLVGKGYNWRIHAVL